MGNTFYMQWEVELIKWLQSFESTITTVLAKFFTFFGEEYFLILILGLCYWCIDKNLGRKISITLSAGMVFGTLIKGVALRRRPYMDNSDIKCIRAAHPDNDIMSPVLQGYSFPSLHATMSTSVFGTILCNTKNKIIGIIAVLMPLFIGVSRPYLGVHYPTDVIAGWILGVLCVALLLLIEKRYNYKIPFLIVLAVGFIGFFYCTDTEFYSAFGVTLGLFLAFLFEEKFVNFKMSDKWWSYILRPVLGILVFLLMSTLLKLPAEFIPLDDTSIVILIYRAVRYTVCTFVTVGVYPMVFKKLKL